MTLHEKGKALLKKKEFADSLYLLLEADKEFKLDSQALQKTINNN